MVNYSRKSRYICQPCPSIIQKPQDNFSKMPSFGFTLFIKPFAILHTSSAAVQLPHSLHEPIHSMGASEHHEIYVVFSIAFDQISRNVSKWISDRNSKNASAEAKKQTLNGHSLSATVQSFRKSYKVKTFLNSTPFVRQYDILSNRWGDLLYQEENRTNGTRRSLRSW